MSTNYVIIIADMVNIIKIFVTAKFIISLQKIGFLSNRSAYIPHKGLIVHSQHQIRSIRNVIEGIDYVGDLCLSTYNAIVANQNDSGNTKNMVNLKTKTLSAVIQFGSHKNISVFVAKINTKD